MQDKTSVHQFWRSKQFHDSTKVAATFPSRPQNTLPVIKQDIDLRMIVITIEKCT